MGINIKPALSFLLAIKDYLKRDELLHHIISTVLFSQFIIIYRGLIQLNISFQNEILCCEKSSAKTRTSDKTFFPFKYKTENKFYISADLIFS